MAIVLPADLPAALDLAIEGLQVLSPAQVGAAPRARIGLLNLMPDKKAAELQFARLLAGGGGTVELVLLRVASHRAKTTAAAHLERFYRIRQDLPDGGLDGLIVTGAPLETLPFQAVDFWPEFACLLDWAEAEVPATLFICWAAQAALHARHGVPKHLRRDKAFGVYTQRVREPGTAILRGLAPSFPVPVSRHSEIRARDLPVGRGLRLLADNPATGPCLVSDTPRRALYMFDHLEYGPRTLREEYLRDHLAGRAIKPPENDPADALARHTSGHPWRAHAELFFRNWLNAAGCLAAAPAARPDRRLTALPSRAVA